ncbi:MAG: hypothetical protein PVH19_05425, partial [Planctomycetia bacterium]
MKDQTPKHAGFPLVKLLVLILIIIISLASYWFYRLYTLATESNLSTQRSTVAREIGQLKMALDKYKDDCGDYPPDCFSTDLANDQDAQKAILRHFRRRFPRYRSTDWAELCSDAAAAGVDLEKLTPTSAMAFFLGGMPMDGQPAGFSANPANPFELKGSRLAPYFDFNPERYEIVNGVPVYYPEYIKTPNTG